MNLTQIDKNLASNNGINKDDIKFYPASCGEFNIFGLYEPYGKNTFTRMPTEVADIVSEGVKRLNHISTGARIRFKTNSKYVAVRSEFHDPTFVANAKSSLVSTSGMDLYVVENGVEHYYNTFVPPVEFGGYYDALIEFYDSSERELIIYLPKTNCTTNLEIGLSGKAYIKKASYKYENPILFYGSSITQGGCATRPGNIYPCMIARHFDTDIVNLGFSGSCKAEDLMIEYLAKQEMSILVYDYDHNAPSAEHLKNTHEKLFKAFRETHPTTPVIIMSKTDLPKNPIEFEATQKRKEIILETYNNAINAGEKNVYFIDGQQIFNMLAGFDCTVDGCHPNDIGFLCMANSVIKVIEENKLLEK